MTPISLGGRLVGPGHRPYVIAEMSGNHNQSRQTALDIVQRAADSGADAIKLQTYTPATLTLRSAAPGFVVPPSAALWAGQRLWDLYESACTPWEWHEEIFSRARALGLACISTAFDATSVAFLVGLDVDAIKIASFEVINLPLIRSAAATGRPLIVSTGMATVDEIAEAVLAARAPHRHDPILLKCTSAYPADIADANLLTIPDMAHRFGCLVGLSDHALTNTGVVCAIALGATVIEKHLTLERAAGGPDSAFSLQPSEFRSMVDAAAEAHAALGSARYGPLEAEAGSYWERPSIYVVKSLRPGDAFSAENVRIIRPSGGLLPKYYDTVIGKRAAADIAEASPLTAGMIDGGIEEP